jgi:hypothetical protein
MNAANGGRMSGRATLETRLPERAFGWGAMASAGAAGIIAIANAIAPIDHGWWLVAYLALVGGLSQSLLGTGLSALAIRTGARRPAESTTWSQFVLWNTGVVLVAAADLTAVSVGVLVGSVLLLAALGFFAVALRRTSATAVAPMPVGVIVYGLLIVFLVGSVVVGTGLAEALPGQ